MKAHVPHQPGDRAARDREAFPPQLPPDLAHAIDAEVLIEHPPDLDFQIRVAADPLGRREGSARLAAWAWYVDGAIGRTLQIGSTPWA